MQIEPRAKLAGIAATLLVSLSFSVSHLAVSAAFAQTKADPYAAATNVGPSSKPVPAVGATGAAANTPYVIPTAAGWSSTSLLTTGNQVKGYTMVGIPDGTGVFDNGDGTVTVLLNQELGNTAGAVHMHGGRGAFVSRWVVNKDTLEVVSGQDFVQSPDKLHLYDAAAKKYVNGSELLDRSDMKLVNIGRLCSADLAPVSSFFNAATGKGYNGRIFLDGEESGNEFANRAFAWVVADGTAWELPAFGFGTPGAGENANPPPSWENVVANPGSGDATVVMANSDGGTNQVAIYIGQKQTDGSPIEKAGLTNGKIWSIAVAGVTAEDRNTNIGIQKSVAGKGEGKRFSLAAPNKGTTFFRPEDGAWDPRNPNRFYFVTTDRNNFAMDKPVREGQPVDQIGRARIWALTFDDVTKIPTDGSAAGKIELLIDGTEGGEMFDNMTVDKAGRMTVNEDPGNVRHNAKIWQYDTNTGAFTTIFQVDPKKFGDVKDGVYTPATAPFTEDEESSGVIDASDAFAGASWLRAGGQVLLTVVQAHFPYDAKDPTGAMLVEGGQLLLLTKTP